MKETSKKMLAERLRQQVAERFCRSGLNVTVSQGIASVSAQGSYEQLLKTADERLSQAKAVGRNVTIQGVPESRLWRDWGQSSRHLFQHKHKKYVREVL